MVLAKTNFANHKMTQVVRSELYMQNQNKHIKILTANLVLVLKNENV
jgi:hypothetical protein